MWSREEPRLIPQSIGKILERAPLRSVEGRHGLYSLLNPATEHARILCRKANISNWSHWIHGEMPAGEASAKPARSEAGDRACAPEERENSETETGRAPQFKGECAYSCGLQSAAV